MTTINITAGSEKQISWANKIVAAWVAEMQREVDASAWRAGTPHEWLIKANADGMQKLIDGLSGKTAKEIIDYSQGRNSPVAAIKKWVMAQQPK
jgi:hypothetical protein